MAVAKISVFGAFSCVFLCKTATLQWLALSNTFKPQNSGQEFDIYVKNFEGN